MTSFGMHAFTQFSCEKKVALGYHIVRIRYTNTFVCACAEWLKWSIPFSRSYHVMYNIMYTFPMAGLSSSASWMY